MSERKRISSGSPYEPEIGFSRAVRVGDRVVVSGTAPIWPDGSCDPDPRRQASRCLELIVAALGHLHAVAVAAEVVVPDQAQARGLGLRLQLSQGRCGRGHERGDGSAAAAPARLEAEPAQRVPRAVSLPGGPLQLRA